MKFTEEYVWKGVLVKKKKKNPIKLYKLAKHGFATMSKKFLEWKHTDSSEKKKVLEGHTDSVLLFIEGHSYILLIFYLSALVC